MYQHKRACKVPQDVDIIIAKDFFHNNNNIPTMSNRLHIYT